jgi:ABC-type uncharacterized transport system involved in gliding motility auxiliary subunit
MASAEPKAGGKGGRVVALGTANFASNTFITAQGPANLALFTDSLDWLAEQENLISIPPKPQRAPQLIVTTQESNLMLFITYLLLPLLFLAGGSVVWYRRRRSFAPAV